jgi:hypothetical protein
MKLDNYLSFLLFLLSSAHISAYIPFSSLSFPLRTSLPSSSLRLPHQAIHSKETSRKERCVIEKNGEGNCCLYSYRQRDGAEGEITEGEKCMMNNNNNDVGYNNYSNKNKNRNNNNNIFSKKPLSSSVEIYNTYTANTELTHSFYPANIEELSKTSFSSTIDRKPPTPQQQQGDNNSNGLDNSRTEVQKQMDIFRELGKNRRNRSPDFEPNVGKVIDTLMKDYRDLFHRVPNFDIYTNDIRVMDPSGVRLNGKLFYKQFFAMLRLVKTVALDRTLINYKVSYDWVDQEVKVQWNLKIWLRTQSQPRYIDGISRYSINDEGKVCAHVIDNLIINNRPIEPPYALEWMSLEAWVELLTSPDPTLNKKDPTPELVPGIAGLPRISMPGEFGFTLPGEWIPASEINDIVEGVIGEKEEALETVRSLNTDIHTGNIGGMSDRETNMLNKQLISNPISRKQVVLHASASSKMEENNNLLSNDEMTQERRRKLLGIDDDNDSGFERGGDLGGGTKKKGNEKTEKKKNSIFGDLGGGMGLPASCESHGDCDHPMFCCDFILFKTCCDKGGLMMPLPEPQSAYPHPSYSRPVRVKAEYPEDKYPDYSQRNKGGYGGTAGGSVGGGGFDDEGGFQGW